MLERVEIVPPMVTFTLKTGDRMGDANPLKTGDPGVECEPGKMDFPTGNLDFPRMGVCKLPNGSLKLPPKNVRI